VLWRGQLSSIRVPSTSFEAAAVFWQHPTAIFAGSGIALLLTARLTAGVSLLDLPGTPSLLLPPLASLLACRKPAAMELPTAPHVPV